MVPPPPAAGAVVVGAGAVETAGLAAVLALATAGALGATDWLAAEALGDDVGEASSAAVAVAGSTVVGVIAAFDFVAGLHAANDNPTTPTTRMPAAADNARTCMAAPCSNVDGGRSRQIEARCGAQTWNRGKPSIRAGRRWAGVRWQRARSTRHVVMGDP
jgi:hypothetical protein